VRLRRGVTCWGLYARWRTVVADAALLAMTLVAYAPALTAGFIWNDHENLVANQTLISREGLRQIWLVPQATQQYSPLTCTSYWIEYRLWGLAAWGYHLTSILLHGLAAVLAWRLLVRLQVPGAWFAAALFAVHPVEVESIAWISERQNVLSLSLVLLSMLCYLRFAPARTEDRIAEIPGAASWSWYALSFGLFALALTANTVVVTMPAVMLVIYWWKRGRITLRDIACIVPFVAVGVAMTLVTLRMEGHHLGTHEKVWSLPAVERFLLAGRALWFYGEKLVWPHPLIFFYPRWTLDSQAWGQYLWPIAALALLAAIWLVKGRIGRGLFAAVLIFVVVLAPTLGFFNNRFMTYAYVADHFEYHASLAILAAAAAIGSLCFRRNAKAVGYIFAGLLLLGLGSLTFQQTFIYHDLETLYRDTIDKNPRDTIARSNLADHFNALGNHEEAICLLRGVVRLDPNDPMAHINLGLFLLMTANPDKPQPEQLEETAGYLRQGIALAQASPMSTLDEPRLHFYLSYCLMQIGYSIGFQPQLLDEILVHLKEATRLDPAYVDAHVSLALALVVADQQTEAIQHAAWALEIEPQGIDKLRNQLGPDLLAEAHYARGGALASKNEFATAADHFRAAVELRPDHDRARNNLGVALMRQGKTDEAIRWFEEAVQGDPKYTDAKTNLENARKVQEQQGTTK
jgi:tetratricopeptide (TPR) repeat protein